MQRIARRKTRHGGESTIDQSLQGLDARRGAGHGVHALRRLSQSIVNPLLEAVEARLPPVSGTAYREAPGERWQRRPGGEPCELATQLRELQREVRQRHDAARTDL